ncbi:L-piperidine-6-carboxylate dehydrogenase [Paludibaculum fermentans]|uniref:Aldehyde dehydrogenase family protein n=1 Tax=Paludibaculum fermentans TaxID=1473598 RepID=A0A7S7NKV5_PALFE|nr:aldehyde dehydrogenase family protein [Paludibaculum fermentans]QOY85501.1 aldehyde dehydrogenase family protein [Paludibaculum fermentans]
MSVEEILNRLGIQPLNSGACGAGWLETPGGGELRSLNPATGAPIASVAMASAADYDTVMDDAAAVFERWRLLPAPKRGEIVRLIGEELRLHKDDLGALVALEMGKILAEGKGEVQEMIDIADFAVGLSRQLYGLTMHSERPGHRMYEQWHPLGVVGVISAFNFPVAVWSWNALIAAVCGDCVLWKPSSETPLTAIAVQNICNRVLERTGWQGVFTLVIGRGSTVGEKMLADKRVPLVSATGSCQMGYRVAEVVGRRLARTILELGGNNGVIVTEDANLDLALRAVLFGAVGTAGQRCTTIRRLFLHKSIAGPFIEKLKAAYAQVRIGDPLDPQTLMGPLVNKPAVEEMLDGLERAKAQGAEILYGGAALEQNGGFFVQPTLVKASAFMPIVSEEIFAPILYILEYENLDQAIAWHNSVPQGLSSAIFTNSLISAETFLSARGSDCGIANVNIGTSGAEIGGAFGGEKETGGGREAGSDSWKAYMRRQTVTINWSKDLPLAQGIEFKV